MNLLTRIRHRAARIYNATFGRGDEQMWRDLGWLPGSGSGVNANTVLGISGVWKAVNVIGKDLAVLPLHKYRRLPDEQGKERVRDNTTRLLNNQANLYVKSVDHRLAVQIQALLVGNGYAEIQRDPAMQPLALWWTPTDNVETEVDEAGSLWYVIRQANKPPRRVRPENMLHIKGPTKDGVNGWSLVSLARESLSLTKGQETYAQTQFENGIRPSLLLKIPGQSNPEKRKELREEIDRMHRGASNAFKAFLLWNGMEASPWSMSNDDAQWLEGRQFQVEEIARWFDLPPHKLGAMGRATWNNVENMQLEYVAGCLQFWLSQWEQECNAKLLTEREKDAESHFYEFKLDALLKGDTLSRYQVYAIARTIGVLNPNEIRAKENMNPREDEEGDSYDNPNTGSPKPDDSGPNAPGDTTDRRDVPDDGNQNPRTRNQQRLEVLATVETQLVLMAAEKSKNFVSYIDKLYEPGSPWSSHVVEVFAACELDGADRWCQDSHARLLDASGKANTNQELRGVVLDLTTDWPLRVNEFCLGAPTRE